MSFQRTVTSSLKMKSWAAMVQHIDKNLVLVFFFPFLIHFINACFLFVDLRGYLDPWIYYGHFTDLKQHLISFKGKYYGTRLPWILPGYIIHHIFSPLIAKYVFQYSILYTTLFSLYAILKKTLSAHAALLTVLLVGVYEPFLNEMGSYYVSGGGIAYFFLILLLLTPSSSQSLSKFRLFVAGVFTSFFLFSQLFFIVYFPFILLYYLFFNAPLSKQIFFKNLRCFALGFLAITLVFCGINYLLNQIFFFFMPIVKWTTGFVKNQNPWWEPFSNWSVHMKLLFPFGVGACGAILTFICRKQLQTQKNVILFFQFFFILNLALFLFFQFFKKQPVLQYHYYFCYLYPTFFLALGGLIAFALEKDKCKNMWLHKGWIFAIGLIGLGLSLRWPSFFHLPTAYKWIPLAGAGLVGVFWLFFMPERYKIGGIYTFAVIFMAVNSDLNHRYDSDFIQKNKHLFLAVHKGTQIVQKIDPKAKALFWIPTGKHPLSGVYQAICSTNFYHARLFSETFPKREEWWHLPSEKQGNQIIVLSHDDEALNQANQSLAPLGWKCTLVKEETVSNAACSFKILLLQVSSLSNLD